MAERQQVSKALPYAPTAFGLDGVIEGFPAIFGNRDSDRQIIEKGAFSKSIADGVARIPVALDHVRGMAVTTYLEEVGRDDLPNVIKSEFPDATGGLFGRAQAVLMGDGLAWVRAERERVRKGAPSGMSFVAGIVRSREGGTVLSELALDEWGPQLRNQAVNRAARVTSIKGAEADPLTPLLDAAADADPEDPEVQGLIAAIKAGAVLSRLNVEDLQAAVERQESALERLKAVLGRAIKEQEDGREPVELAPPASAKGRAARARSLELQLDILRQRAGITV